MKVFLAGGNGFIGSVLTRRLHRAGYRVRCLLRPGARTDRIDDLPFERCGGDVLDVDTLRRGMQGCGAAVNLAYSTRWSLLNSSQQKAAAITGTRNMLLAARAAGIGRVVQVSSIAAVGASRRPRIHDETSAFNLAGCRPLRYAHYKHRAEELCRQAAAQGQDVVVVNPAEVYGPDDLDLVTAGNLIDLLAMRPVTVTTGGVCVVHVDDVARGIVLALEEGRTGERYILGGQNVSLREMAALCLDHLGLRRRILTVPAAALRAAVRGAQLLGRTPPFEPDLVPYASRYWFMDNAKARRELGAEFRDARATLGACLDWLADTGRLPGVATEERTTDAAVS
jgi:dihydroflavonol-4-reductase